MTIFYKNIEVLSDRLDASAAEKSTLGSKLSIVSSTVGVARVIDQRGIPARARSIRLFAHGRKYISELRGFIARRKGRVVPFWLSGASSALVSAAAAAAGTNKISVIACGYSDGVFVRAAGRYLDIAGQYVKVTSSVDNGNGTETLTLEDNLAGSVAAGDTISFLGIFRLSSDENRIDFEHVELASSGLDIVELGREL